VAFLVAHLTDARHFLVELLGAPIPDPLGAALADVRSIDGVKSPSPLPEILAAWATVRAHLSRVRWRELGPARRSGIRDVPDPGR
jgi:hypothetical protein